MTGRASRDIESIIRDGTAIDRAIVRARRRVIRQHRQQGIPLAIWRDGRVITVPADSVELPEDDGEAGTSGPSR